MLDAYAPTFEVARTTMAEMLDGWVFGRIQRVTRPDPDKPYFHGIMVMSNGNRVWFQQTTAARQPMSLGPIGVEVCTTVPQNRDVLMGRLAVRGDTNRERLINWYTNVAAIQNLAQLWTAGTTKHEMQLMHDLRTQNDDLWALCRLVLFGNIGVFVEAHRGTRVTGMKLSCAPLEFVYRVANTLDDESVWEAFAHRVPGALPPTPPREPTPPPPKPWISPPQTRPKPWISPPQPRPKPWISPPQTRPKPWISPPHSPPYNPCSPPQSPPYNPCSPPQLPPPPHNPPQSYNPPHSYNPSPNPPNPKDTDALLQLLRGYAMSYPSGDTDAYDPQ